MCAAKFVAEICIAEIWIAAEVDTSMSFTYQQKLPHHFLHIVMHMNKLPWKIYVTFSHSSLEYLTLKRKGNLERGRDIIKKN